MKDRQRTDIFDRPAALAELDGDEQLLGELAGLFLGECPQWLAEVRAALAEHPLVRAHEPAGPAEGGEGATIVEL